MVTIDGHSVHGWDGDKAAHFLRGRKGSSVNVRIARRTTQTPGVAGRPPPPYTEYKQVSNAYHACIHCALQPCFASAHAQISVTWHIPSSMSPAFSQCQSFVSRETLLQSFGTRAQ